MYFFNIDLILIRSILLLNPHWYSSIMSAVFFELLLITLYKLHLVRIFCYNLSIYYDFLLEYWTYYPYAHVWEFVRYAIRLFLSSYNSSTWSFSLHLYHPLLELYSFTILWRFSLKSCVLCFRFSQLIVNSFISYLLFVLFVSFSSSKSISEIVQQFFLALLIRFSWQQFTVKILLQCFVVLEKLFLELFWRSLNFSRVFIQTSLP